MTDTRPLTVLVASDGSAESRAAVSVALRMPWPDRVRLAGVVATAPAGGLGGLFPKLFARSYDQEVRRLETVLRERSADARVASLDLPPVEAILRERRRHGADVVIVGSRGHGAFGRFPLGSVSRRLVREAPCAVLVGKRRVRDVGRILLAVDGSPASTRGVQLLARLQPAPGHRALLVAVVAPVPLPTMGRAPASVRADVRRLAAAEERKRTATAQRHLDAAARRLRRAGWKVSSRVLQGSPVKELLAQVRAWHPDLVVCGERSTAGVNRILLGSVAEGLVSGSPVSVLVAK